jgi:hypothetical protein
MKTDGIPEASYLLLNEERTKYSFSEMHVTFHGTIFTLTSKEPYKAVNVASCFCMGMELLFNLHFRGKCCWLCLLCIAGLLVPATSLPSISCRLCHSFTLFPMKVWSSVDSQSQWQGHAEVLWLSKQTQYQSLTMESIVGCPSWCNTLEGGPDLPVPMRQILCGLLRSGLVEAQRLLVFYCM